MLPEAEHDPTCLPKGRRRLDVPLPVSGKLGRPVVRMCRRHDSVVGAPVPEASVEVDGEPRAGEDDVSARAQTRHGREVDPVAMTSTMEFSTDTKFERGVASSVGAHGPGGPWARGPRFRPCTHAIDATCQEGDRHERLQAPSRSARFSRPPPAPRPSVLPRDRNRDGSEAPAAVPLDATRGGLLDPPASERSACCQSWQLHRRRRHCL